MDTYRLRLFIAGQEPNSVRALNVLTRLKEEHLKERCELVVIDVFQNYQVAIEEHIIAVPALIVESPPPRRVIVGSLTDEERLLAVLGRDPKGLEDL